MSDLTHHLDTLPLEQPHRNDYDVCISELITRPALEDMIEALLQRQRVKNFAKATRNANRRTNDQALRYFDRLFPRQANEEDNIRTGALLMLYIQRFAEKASFLGATRYVSANKHRSFGHITDEYFELVAGEEREALYDAIESFQGLRARQINEGP